MSDSFDHFVIPKFGGINLDARAHAISPDETDDLCNVWGNGTYFTKRPGFRFLAHYPINQAQGIMDMVRGTLIGTGAFAQAHDAIHLIHSMNKYASFNICTQAKGSGSGSLPSPIWNTIRLIPCNDRIAITGVNTGTSNYHVAAAGQDYSVVTSTVSPPARFAFGAWHKNHLFETGLPESGFLHDVSFSDYALPAVWPTPNRFTSNPMGALNQSTGIYSDGEYLYIGKTGEIYCITGSSIADFRMERITNSVGFADCRGMCSIGDMVIGFNCESGGFDYSDSTVQPIERIIPRGIISIRGMQVDTAFGEKVNTLFDSQPASRLVFPKAAYDYRNRYAMLLNAQATSANQVISAVYEKTAGAWFKWRFDSLVAGNSRCVPVCMAYAPGPTATSVPRMYIGTNIGGIGWLDPTNPEDDSTDVSGTHASWHNQIESYWTSAWITRKSFENFKSLEDVFIQGKPNTAGDDPTLSVAVDYSPTFVPIGTFPLREDGTLVSVSGKVNMSRSVKIKISFANNSYGGEVRRVVLAQKGFGIK